MKCYRFNAGAGTYSADTAKAVPLFRVVRLSCVKCRTTFQAYELLYLPRDAMRKRGLCCRQVSVRLFFCLSIRHVRVQTAEDIVKLLSRPCSATILVFLNPSARTQFQEPLQRGAKYTQSGKNSRLSTKIAVYLGNGTIEIGPWLL